MSAIGMQHTSMKISPATPARHRSSEDEMFSAVAVARNDEPASDERLAEDSADDDDQVEHATDSCVGLRRGLDLVISHADLPLSAFSPRGQPTAGHRRPHRSGDRKRLQPRTGFVPLFVLCSEGGRTGAARPEGAGEIFGHQDRSACRSPLGPGVRKPSQAYMTFVQASGEPVPRGLLCEGSLFITSAPERTLS